MRNSQEMEQGQLDAQRESKNLTSPPAPPRVADRPKQSTADSILLQLDAMDAIPGSNPYTPNQLPPSKAAHGNEYGSVSRRRNEQNNHDASSYTLLLP